MSEDEQGPEAASRWAGPRARVRRAGRQVAVSLRRLGRATRPVVRRLGWGLPLTGGILLGVALVTASQCLVNARFGDVDVPQGPVDAQPDLILTLTNSYLTQQIQQAVDRGASPIPLRNIRVTTRDVDVKGGKEGRVFVFGNVDFAGRGVDGVIEMRPVLEEGEVRMKVVSAKFGILPIPGNIERLVEAPVNDRIQAAVAGYPATITSVRAVPDGVTATAKLRPRGSPTPTPARTGAVGPNATATQTTTAGATATATP